MDIQKKKIENVILFFANKSENNTIDRLKLIKLIWLSDRLHLNKYGRLIVNDIYNALPLGPVASTTLNFSNNTVENTFKVEGKYNIKALKESDFDFFSKSDVKIMNYVWKKFGTRDAFNLKDFSHTFPEWKRFEKEILSPNKPSSYPMNMYDFFKFPKGIDFSDILSKEEIKLSESDYKIHNTVQNFLNS